MLNLRTQIGLTKSVGTTTACRNSTCDNLLEWLDGTPFTYESYYEKTVDYTLISDCFLIMQNEKIIDENCDTDVHFICQFDCSLAGKPKFQVTKAHSLDS